MMCPKANIKYTILSTETVGLSNEANYQQHFCQIWVYIFLCRKKGGGSVIKIFTFWGLFLILVFYSVNCYGDADLKYYF